MSPDDPMARMRAASPARTAGAAAHASKDACKGFRVHLWQKTHGGAGHDNWQVQNAKIILYFSDGLNLVAQAGPSTAATVCNGYSEVRYIALAGRSRAQVLTSSFVATQYCSRRYSNVTVVGAHSSYTASNTNLAADQDHGGELICVAAVRSHR